MIKCDKCYRLLKNSEDFQTEYLDKKPYHLCHNCYMRLWNLWDAYRYHILKQFMRKKRKTESK